MNCHGNMVSSHWFLANSFSNAAPRRGSLRNSFPFTIRNIILSLISTLHIVTAQNCIELAGSTMCPAFSQASVSTTDSLVVSLLYGCLTFPQFHLLILKFSSPFLQSVSSTASFDEHLGTYVSSLYVKKKYQTL